MPPNDTTSDDTRAAPPLRWVTFDAISMPLPETWNTVTRTSRMGSKLLEAQVEEGTVLLLLPAIESLGQDWTMPRFLSELIDGHTVGREIVQREPSDPILGITETGCYFATQQCISTSPFGDVWFCTYWTLGIDDHRVQPLIGLSGHPESLKQLLDHIGPLIDAVVPAE